MCSCDGPDAMYGYSSELTLLENLVFGESRSSPYAFCVCPDSYLIALGSLEGWLVPAVAAGIVAGVVLSNRAKSVWKPFVAWLAVMVIVFFKDYLRHNESWKAGREMGGDAAELNEIIADYF